MFVVVTGWHRVHAGPQLGCPASGSEGGGWCFASGETEAQSHRATMIPTVSVPQFYCEPRSQLGRILWSCLPPPQHTVRDHVFLRLSVPPPTPKLSFPGRKGSQSPAA